MKARHAAALALAGWYLMVPCSNIAVMKKVEAIIRVSKLEGVRDALSQIGVRDVAVESYFSKLKIGVIVSDEITPQVVNTIESARR
jgi:nitrogen regulatory protein PII